MKRWNPEGLPPAERFRHIVEHETTGLIFPAGQVAWNEAGEIVGDDMATQFDEILRHFDIILDDLGLGKDSIIKMTSYVLSCQEFREGRDGGPAALDAFAEYFPEEAKAAATMVEVPELFVPGLLIEVDLIIARTP